jgi:hypothetical protein
MPGRGVIAGFGKVELVVSKDTVSFLQFRTEVGLGLGRRLLREWIQRAEHPAAVVFVVISLLCLGGSYRFG